MTAAIYARKSTQQTGVDDDQKSVARQIDNARAFAAAKGWPVPDAHVYADEAISGADTHKLKNRTRLLDAVTSGQPPFSVIIMRDASRFSRRDGDEAFGELKRLAQRGVQIWFYQDGSRFTYGSFGDNVVGFVRAETNAEYRRQISRWVTEALTRKVQAGHSAGGRVFGYDSVRVEKHAERRINEAEAAVVRRIFALSITGCGASRIAKLLNAEGAVRPLSRGRRAVVPGWSPSSVAEVLARPLYRGVLVWNVSTYKDGRRIPRPESEWMQDPQPHLRIVDDQTWYAAQRKKRADGRRLRDVDSAHALSGFSRCSVCGGALIALRRSKTRVVYGCISHHQRGAAVCGNRVTLTTDCLEMTVLDKIAYDSLRPAVVRALVDGVFKQLQPATVTRRAKQLRADLKAVDAKIAHLTAAVESGAAVAPLIAQLQARQVEREQLLIAIGAADSLNQMHIDRPAIERKILRAVDEWRALLSTNVRQFLREALDGPIQFTPDGKSNAFHFHGRLRMGDIIEGAIGSAPFAATGGGSAKGCTVPFAGIAA